MYRDGKPLVTAYQQALNNTINQSVLKLEVYSLLKVFWPQCVNYQLEIAFLRIRVLRGGNINGTLRGQISIPQKTIVICTLTKVIQWGTLNPFHNP